MAPTNDSQENNQVQYNQAGQLKKGDFIIIKDRPCKIIEIHKSKPGKHGAAKARFVGMDLLLKGKKYECIYNTGEAATCPVVVRYEAALLSMDDCDVNVLRGAKSETIPVPKDDELANQIRQEYEGGEQLLLQVLCALGQQEIVGCRRDNSN